MAKDEKPEQKPNNNGSIFSSLNKERKRINMSAKAVVDNIVFSKSDATAYYKLTPKMFDFLSSAMQISDAALMTSGLTNLVENRTEPLDLHFITTSEPFDVEAWHAQVRSISSGWAAPREFEVFTDQMANYLLYKGYSNRTAYMGVSLGRRGAINFSNMNPLEAGFKGAIETIKEWLGSVLKTFDEDVSAGEEHEFRAKEEHYFNMLRSSNIVSGKVTAQEILLLIKRPLFPAMPVPYLEVDHENRLGPGDLDLETAGVILNKFRMVEFNQFIENKEIKGYRAVISLTKFPKEGRYPYSSLPFMYIPEKVIGLPLTTYARVKLLPHERMRKEVENRRKQEIDQIKNKTASAQSVANSIVSDESLMDSTLTDLRQLDEMTNMDKTPWVEGNYRVVVEASTEKALLELVALVRQKYYDAGISSVLSSGDQLELLLEQLPGDHTRIKSFKQLTNLNHLSSAGLNISSNVGDPIWSDANTRG